MHIVDLKDGGASLEFSEAEAKSVSQALKRMGAKRVQSGAVHDVVRIGDDELIYYFEWDDPCLIAQTPRGSEHLQRLLAGLSESKAA